MANKIYYMDEEYTGGGGADTGTVTQIPTDEDSELSVLLSRSSSNQSETDNVKKNSSFKFNPDDNVLKVGDIESSSATGYFGESLAYTSVSEIADSLNDTVSDVNSLSGYVSYTRDRLDMIYTPGQYSSEPGAFVAPAKFAQEGETGYLTVNHDDLNLSSGYWFGATGDTGVSKSLKDSVDYLYDNLGGGGFDPTTSSILTAEDDGYISYNYADGGIITPDLVRSNGDDWTGTSGYFSHSSLVDTLADIATDLYETSDNIDNSTLLAGESGGYLSWDSSANGFYSPYGFVTDQDVFMDDGYWLGSGSETYSFTSLKDTLDNLNQRLLALEGNV